MLLSRLRPLPALPYPSSTDDLRGDAAVAAAAEDEAEDIFAAFLPHLLPDDAPQFHGDPGQCLLYSSPRYGDLTIQVPSYPDQSGSASSSPKQSDSDSSVNSVDSNSDPGQVDAQRSLFAHFVWSAGLIVAEAVEDAHAGREHVDEMWRVEGEKVLELGAGAALPSTVSILAGASEVTITDHPSSPALRGAIAFNLKRNIPATNGCAVSVQPHEWGTLASDSWAMANRGRFTRIIAADCLWMELQHKNLAQTMKWFLAPEGRIWLVAGLHTGRPVVVKFLKTAMEMGLEVDTIYERDQTTSWAEGDGEIRRDWVEVREEEGPENRARWCIVARLRHAC
ncbi:hypothetical protein ASPACDRAFT_81086 [Aspergillus aculeatus ATCC 16872]|uniref:Nicotinamide N-methyltransferase n=1 Tax=Aspergillus aculeatus (strain ATCC 16872 / CBS 172.66 / WB 5094) TaxID=690307 RepID=A0A1L9WL89_ASPA1|nr:uncharacterized protein ASPACDRAFT_81086 [Aspergillus aculeatus ATCC 16872]OJJ96911.1 hypothetical protein ASPACDRAFT_81086 [Aspergillus aculeatus ATCC 16872]